MTADDLRRMLSMRPDREPTFRRINRIEEARLIQEAWRRAGFSAVCAWVDPITGELRTNLRPGGLPPHD